MSLLRRGFKTEANAIAREIRRELGLNLVDPLDPHLLAVYLAIPVVPLSEFRMEAPKAVAYFLSHDPSSFSAVTVFRGPTRIIVYNDGHTDGRQASNLAHELSHGLLLHPPLPARQGLLQGPAELAHHLLAFRMNSGVSSVVVSSSSVRYWYGLVPVPKRPEAPRRSLRRLLTHRPQGALISNEAKA